MNDEKNLSKVHRGNGELEKRDRIKFFKAVTACDFCFPFWAFHSSWMEKKGKEVWNVDGNYRRNTTKKKLRIIRSDSIQQSCFIALTLRHRHRLQIARIAVTKEQEWKDKQMHLNANFLQSSRFHRASSSSRTFFFLFLAHIENNFFKYFISIRNQAIDMCAWNSHSFYLIDWTHTLYGMKAITKTATVTRAVWFSHLAFQWVV